jgi:hypothetical protein
MFIVGGHKRSWLNMLNPLTGHKPNQSHETITGGTSDFEIPVSTDNAGYIGKSKIRFSIPI